ncbi:MAG: nicotinate phosphoribosyltransferase [bacterium]|nr:nicotinate phosphoribosyltransferase [bacterium]
MSDHPALTRKRPYGLDIEGIRRGFYSDVYFENVVRILEQLQRQKTVYQGDFPRIRPSQPLLIGDLIVEVQVFNRRAPHALIAGMPAALAVLRHAVGYWDGDQFIETWPDVEVEAVADGTITLYDQNPLNVCPVLKMRGRYRDFALLETVLLGILTRASRIATHVYDTIQAANGKPVLFFPARFDLPDVQALDGYAYSVAVTAYNAAFNKQMPTQVSTAAQASWWGGRASGTIPHALIAAFLGDTAAAMIAYAEHIPLDSPRIVLADFNNDVIGDSLRTMRAFWERYSAAYRQQDADAMRRWTLHGVRIDTSPTVRDQAMAEGEPAGISPLLVRRVRAALDSAHTAWQVPDDLHDAAVAFCQGVKIVATGGFNRERITAYEAENVPVDVYGVGSRFLRNDSETNTDFTMDIVRVKVDGAWVDMAKTGRRGNMNPDLHPVDLGQVEDVV